MSLTLQESETANVVRFEGAVDISSAAELKDLLLQALGSGKEVHLSLAEAQSLDVTAVQLLWAAERHARTSGVALSLDDHVPEPVSAALKSAGFNEFPG